MGDRAVVLDRDGVINELVRRGDGSLTAPWTTDEFRFKPGVLACARDLRDMGFRLFVATNQPGVNDGDMRSDQLLAMNRMVEGFLGVEKVFFALERGQPDYKPNNFMIERIVEEYGISRYDSYLVGDRWKDVAAGRKSGLTTIQVIGGPADYSPEWHPHHWVRSLDEAVAVIRRETHLNYYAGLTL